MGACRALFDAFAGGECAAHARVREVFRLRYSWPAARRCAVTCRLVVSAARVLAVSVLWLGLRVSCVCAAGARPAVPRQWR